MPIKYIFLLFFHKDGLSEDDKERLFFFINKDYAKALDAMRKEAWKNHQQGKSVGLRDLK